jgi:hypothetical protein
MTERISLEGKWHLAITRSRTRLQVARKVRATRAYRAAPLLERSLTMASDRSPIGGANSEHDMGQGSHSTTAVDGFADDVGVAGVPSGLLDHVPASDSVTIVTGVVAQPLPATPPPVDGVRVGTARAVPTGDWPRYCRSPVARHLAATATEHEE